MQNFDVTLNKNSKQLLNLAKTLKSDVSHKVFQDISLKLKPSLEENIRSDGLYHNFKPHPQRLFSDSDLSLESIQHDFGSFNCRQILKISASPSENSVSSSFSMALPQEAENKRNSNLGRSKQRAQEILTDHRRFENVDSNKCDRLNNLDVTKSITRSRLKVTHIIQKILSCLEDIRMPTDIEVEPPDGAQDLDRLRKRTTEFSSRFARNYLYPLERQTNLLSKVTRCTHKIGRRSILNIQQNLLAAHRTVLQALKNFCAHLMSCIGNVLVEKLKYLSEQINILCRIHLKCLNLVEVDNDKCENLIRDLESKCVMVLNKMWESTNAPSRINTNSNTKISLTGLNSKQPKKHSILKARLSMYSMSSSTQNKDTWKKAVNNLARHKFRYGNIRSRYKTVGYKDKGVDEKLKMDVTSKSKTCIRKSSSNLKNTPLNTLCDEDKIQTMVEFHKDNEHLDANNSETATHDDPNGKASYCENVPNLVTVLQELCQRLSKSKNEAMTQKSLETILKGFLEMAQDDKINSEREFSSNKMIDVQSRVDIESCVQPYQLSHKEDENIENNKCTKRDYHVGDLNLADRKRNKSKVIKNDTPTSNRQIISISGSKNAQLICMKSREDNAQNAKDMQNCTKSRIKRLPKKILKQLNIPKTEACAAISYKFQYYQYTKGNTMYTKSSLQQPWVIVDFLSERLLDELIMSVTKEIQIEDIIQNLYESEFQ